MKIIDVTFIRKIDDTDKNRKWQYQHLKIK